MSVLLAGTLINNTPLLCRHHKLHCAVLCPAGACLYTFNYLATFNVAFLFSSPRVFVRKTPGQLLSSSHKVSTFCSSYFIITARLGYYLTFFDCRTHESLENTTSTQFQFNPTNIPHNIPHYVQRKLIQVT